MVDFFRPDERLNWTDMYNVFDVTNQELCEKNCQIVHYDFSASEYIHKSDFASRNSYN